MNAKFTQRQEDRFCRLIDLPDFLVPWIDRFYEVREMELVLFLGRTGLSSHEIRLRWSTGSDETGTKEMETFLERSVKRGVVHRGEGFEFHVADFHTRYDIWALFDGWKDVPAEVRESLNLWELTFYQGKCLPRIDELRQGKPRDLEKRWPEYILLHEAESLIDRVEKVYLWPCNCRSMVGRCKNPVYTCLRFSNHLGIGWEISKHKAREIIREANEKGLMQNGEISVLPDGRISGAICNCCADCCFPHLLAERVHAEKTWPLTRYVARLDRERCTACGRCARRCPFNAFTTEYIGKSKAERESKAADPKLEIKFDPGMCRGCGVCSTGCKDKAITMRKLDGVDSLYDKISEV